MAGMSIRISPRSGSNPMRDVGNAAVKHLTPRSARGAGLSVRLTGLNATLCSNLSGRRMADELAVAHGYCLDRYDRIFLFIEVLAYNITMYKSQHYNVECNLIFRWSQGSNATSAVNASFGVW